MTKTELFLPGDWLEARDGFCLCRRPLSTLLHRLGIRDTGISPINKQDVDGYFDDWHLFRLGQNPTVCGLAKLREQDIAHFSDSDDYDIHSSLHTPFRRFIPKSSSGESPAVSPAGPAYLHQCPRRQGGASVLPFSLRNLNAFAAFPLWFLYAAYCITPRRRLQFPNENPVAKRRKKSRRDEARRECENQMTNDRSLVFQNPRSFRPATRLT